MRKTALVQGPLSSFSPGRSSNISPFFGGTASGLPVFWKINVIFKKYILGECSEFSANLLTKTLKRVIMNWQDSSFYQNRIYPNLWILVICIGIITFFFSIWLSIWLRLILFILFWKYSLSTAFKTAKHFLKSFTVNSVLFQKIWVFEPIFYHPGICSSMKRDKTGLLLSRWRPGGSGPQPEVRSRGNSDSCTGQWKARMNRGKR